MEQINFKHIIPIQLRFNDIDQFGHVNNSVYFSFYDLGKTNYFAHVCPHVDWNKDAIMVVHLEIDFKEQIYATNEIAVRTAVIEIGNKSFQLHQQVVDLQTNQVKCECKSTMVTYDLENHASKVMPDHWKQAICEYEGRDVRRK